MAVFQIKLGLDGLTDSDLVSYVQFRIDDIVADPVFPGPGAFPELDDTIVKKATFVASLSAADEGTKADTLQKNADRTALQESTTILAYKCRELSGFDPIVFARTGFGVKQDGEPVGLSPRPTGLGAAEGPFSGSITLDWDAMEEADSFVVQMQADPINPSRWEVVDEFPTASKLTITELVSGTQYWFRVAAVNAAGRSEYSDPATKFAP